MLKVGERPAATAGLGEQDHLLVITDTGMSAKRLNNNLKPDGDPQLKQKAGSEWL